MERFLKRARMLRSRALATTRADSIQLNLRGIIVVALLLDGGRGDDCQDRRQRHHCKDWHKRQGVLGVPCCDWRRSLSREIVLMLGSLLQAKRKDALGAVQLAYDHAIAAWKHLDTTSSKEAQRATTEAEGSGGDSAVRPQTRKGVTGTRAAESATGA